MPIIMFNENKKNPAVCVFQLLAVGLCAKDCHSDNKVNQQTTAMDKY